MPAVVRADVGGASPVECRSLQADLVAAHRADFAKYRGRMDRDLINAVLSAVAASVGGRFVYSRVGEGVRQHQAKAALERLAAARVCHLVRHSAGNGLPLSAEVKERLRKALLLDVGLLHALRGTPAGQALRLAQPAVGDGPAVYYWQRVGGRPGEIDYLLEANGVVVPVEVKAGAAGSMKSLHQFMHDKGLELAVRCDPNPPSLMKVEVSTTLRQPVGYDLLSLPVYLCWNLATLCEAVS